MKMDKYDFLVTYGIPYKLMDKLHGDFELQREIGQPVPDDWVIWLENWRRVLTRVDSLLISDLDSAVKGERRIAEPC